MNWKKIKLLVLDIQQRYQRHNITAFSAQMAFFFVLSIFPLMIFVLMLATRFDVVISLQTNDVLRSMPEEIREFLMNFVDQMQVSNGTALISFAGLGTLYAASRATTALQRAMNAVYEIDETRSFVRLKLTGMYYTLLFTLLIIATVLIPNLGLRAFEWFGQYVPNFFDIGFISLWKIIRILFLVALYVMLFGSIYSFLPNAHIKFRDAYYGAIFALIGAFIENIAFSTIVTKLSNYAVLYGSLSAIIVFMIWLYVLGIIIMMGAEINAMVWKWRHLTSEVIQKD